MKVSIVDSNRCARNKDKCGTLAHELGHQFGLPDTYANSGQKETPGNPVEDGSFSWFHHEFAPGVEYFGTPRYAYLDFMGNGGSDYEQARTWSDLKTWNFLKAKLLFVGQSQKAQQVESTAAGNYVIVQGQINKNGTASFGNFYTLTLTDPDN